MARWCLLPVLFFPVLLGCARENRCKTEVIDDSGKFEAIVAGRRPDDELRRESLRAACVKRCARTDGAEGACVSRCTVDAVAGKIGMRSTCSEREIARSESTGAGER